MAENPNEKEIERLLKELRSHEAHRRKTAVDQLAELGVSKDEVIHALQAVADGDPNQHVRASARRALGQDAPPSREPAPAPSTPAKPVKPLSRNEKIRDFLIGFLGWFIVNGVAWGSTGGVGYADLNCILLPLNLLALIISTFVRRWIALGLLAAFAANYALAILIGVYTNGICWIPFYVR